MVGIKGIRFEEAIKLKSKEKGIELNKNIGC